MWRVGGWNGIGVDNVGGGRVAVRPTELGAEGVGSVDSIFRVAISVYDTSSASVFSSVVAETNTEWGLVARAIAGTRPDRSGGFAECREFYSRVKVKVLVGSWGSKFRVVWATGTNGWGVGTGDGALVDDVGRDFVTLL